MTLCPIAVVAGCRKCPAFALCPLKGVLGDYKPNAEAPDASAASDRRESAARKAGARKR